MSHVLLKVWKTDKFFNVMRHGQVSSGDIKNYKFFKVVKNRQVFRIYEKVGQVFSKRWEKHKVFRVHEKSQVFQGYEKQTGFSNLWKIRIVFEKVMKITSLITKAWKKSQVLGEPTLLQIWSVKIGFTSD